MTRREFEDRLSRRARRAGLTLSTDLVGKLETYYQLLATWNNRINLTGLDLSQPTPEALDRLIVEPLAAAQYAPVGSQRIIDVGSGGGSPAIPFTLALPDARMLMVEAKIRKSVFLREAIRALELTRADVLTSRYEELLTRPLLHEAHDILTIRAVRIEQRSLMKLEPFVRPGGRLFLFRSGNAVPTNLSRPLVWRATHSLVDSLRSQLVVIEKQR